MKGKIGAHALELVQTACTTSKYTENELRQAANEIRAKTGMNCLVETSSIEAYLDAAEAKRKKATDELVNDPRPTLRRRTDTRTCPEPNAKLPHPEDEQAEPHMVMKGPLTLTEKGRLR